MLQGLGEERRSGSAGYCATVASRGKHREQRTTLIPPAWLLEHTVPTNAIPAVPPKPFFLNEKVKVIKCTWEKKNHISSILITDNLNWIGKSLQKLQGNGKDKQHFKIKIQLAYLFAIMESD